METSILQDQWEEELGGCGSEGCATTAGDRGE